MNRSPDGRAARLAVLAVLWDGLANGTIGTPRERLAAIAAKQKREAFLARFAKLDIRTQGQIWLQMCTLSADQDPDDLLSPDEPRQ